MLCRLYLPSSRRQFSRGRLGARQTTAAVSAHDALAGALIGHVQKVAIRAISDRSCTARPITNYQGRRLLFGAYSHDVDDCSTFMHGMAITGFGYSTF